MNAETSLLELLERWKALTEAEGSAIRLGEWVDVAKIQGEKRSLQPEIEALASMEERRNDSGKSDSKVKAKFLELISLEEKNAFLLEEKRTSAAQTAQHLEVVTRNLRQVHRAYSPGQGPVWHSYS